MQTVLRRMRGRAILADEVGLGKTIEAGLVLSELRMRGLADRALVITPAGLVGPVARGTGTQVRPAHRRSPRAAAGRTATDRPVVLASLAAARRDPLRPALTGRSSGIVVIVDEAHRLRNPRSASGKLARALRTRYLLLLTATPVENRLQDLYELVSLVAPGLLGTTAQFRRTHGTADTDVGALRNVAVLRARHPQGDGPPPAQRGRGAASPPRWPRPCWSPPAHDEQALRRHHRRGSGSEAPRRHRRAAAGAAQRSPGSPGRARLPRRRTLDKTRLGRSGRAGHGRSAAPRRPTRCSAGCARHVERGEKVLVFTAFRHDPGRAGRRGGRRRHPGRRLPRQPVARGEGRRGGRVRRRRPGAAVHRVRRRGPQPAVLPRDDQLSTCRGTRCRSSSGSAVCTGSASSTTSC